MNPLLKMPIRMQLLVIVAIVAVPAAGIIIYSGEQNRKQAIEHARAETQTVVGLVASEQRLMLASAQQLLITLAQLPEINEKEAANTTFFLRRILRLHPTIGNIFVADRAGFIWASAAPFEKKINVADRRYFKNAIATGRLSSGEYQIGRISHKPSLNFGYPYWDSRGRLTGVICVSLDMQRYKDLLEQFRPPGRTQMVLIDHDGMVLFGVPQRGPQTGKAFDQRLFRWMQLGPDTATSIASGLAGDSPGEKRYISYQKLRLQGEPTPYMYVWVGIPVESALSAATSRLVKNMSLLGLVLISALLLALFIGKYSISDRITVLERASLDVANGELGMRVSDAVRGGELGRLAGTFDAMTRELLSREQILGEKQRLLEDLNANLELRVTEAVAELRNKDQMLIQQGRQAAMGEVVGNIAHQWRQPLNMLGLIIQEMGMLYDHKLLSKESIYASTQKAMAVINSMSKTIDDFGSYFKPDHTKKVFNVSTALSKTLSLVLPMMNNQHIEVKISKIEPVEVYGFESEYAQVLLAIITNCKDAFEAIGLERQRIIDITVSRIDKRSLVTVADNAGGINPGIIDKIFDPYFTTKGPDKGTGIGLYMAKTIIEQHMGGRLTVRNLKDGAQFRIEV
ncbi:sensor histidine kinase [Geomonas anaerohicana]|uniref:histidine kinase n=1 Tax=Geomonas anaerohicana TaxID=2798583 RepID=A0ABS0YGB4_9BACT|nr:cache domain-containing protein [Geomonas anaerohicana]MBJ6751363.1 HAMP domain-containing protein [Geomonas anaerohicana]